MEQVMNVEQRITMSVTSFLIRDLAKIVVQYIGPKEDETFNVALPVLNSKSDAKRLFSKRATRDGNLVFCKNRNVYSFHLKTQTTTKLGEIPLPIYYPDVSLWNQNFCFYNRYGEFALHLAHFETSPIKRFVWNRAFRFRNAVVMDFFDDQIILFDHSDRSVKVYDKNYVLLERYYSWQRSEHGPRYAWKIFAQGDLVVLGIEGLEDYEAEDRITFSYVTVLHRHIEESYTWQPKDGKGQVLQRLCTLAVVHNTVYLGGGMVPFVFVFNLHGKWLKTIDFDCYDMIVCPKSRLFMVGRHEVRVIHHSLDSLE